MDSPNGIEVSVFLEITAHGLFYRRDVEILVGGGGFSMEIHTAMVRTGRRGVKFDVNSLFLP